MPEVQENEVRALMRWTESGGNPKIAHAALSLYCTFLGSRKRANSAANEEAFPKQECAQREILWKGGHLWPRQAVFMSCGI